MFDRLDQSFEQQRQFTADASHEFRTPLSIMLASCELALSKNRSAEEYRDQLEKCQRAASRMRELGDSLLTLANLDANPQLEFQDLDLSSMLEEAIDFYSTISRRKTDSYRSEIDSMSSASESVGCSGKPSTTCCPMRSNTIGLMVSCKFAAAN